MSTPHLIWMHHLLRSSKLPRDLLNHIIILTQLPSTDTFNHVDPSVFRKLRDVIFIIVDHTWLYLRCFILVILFTIKLNSIAFYDCRNCMVLRFSLIVDVDFGRLDGVIPTWNALPEQIVEFLCCWFVVAVVCEVVEFLW